MREARAGEKLVTLDGEERELEVSDLVITVADKPVALAGVMGGAATEISGKSTRVVLEAAVFDGKSIRKTSGRLNLRSESSSRFEKGINVATVNEALDAAASMIADLAGATVQAGIVSAGSLDTSDVEVVSVSRMSTEFWEQIYFIQILWMSSADLALACQEMLNSSLSVSLAVAGIFQLKRISMKKLPAFTAMTNYQLACQKMTGQLVN